MFIRNQFILETNLILALAIILVYCAMFSLVGLGWVLSNRLYVLVR